jgi:elongation factor G
MATLLGRETAKVASASAGETVALGKLDHAATGDALVPEKAQGPSLDPLPGPPSLYAVGVRPKERSDEVKLSTALTRLIEEDPSLAVEHNQATGETILHGSGEMHLRIALERLENRAQISFDTHEPSIAYRETITRPVTSAAATRSSPADTGNMATWCWTSGHSSPVAGSSSPTPSLAGPCQSSSSDRLKPA